MRRVALAAGVAAILVMGCGVGVQNHATSIPSRAIPAELLSPRDSPAPSASQPASTSTIYLVRNGVLVAVHRPASETSTLSALLRSLLQGPTDAETQSGLVTAINTNPILNRVTFSGSVANIDLASTFGDIRGQGQILATAQVVMTAVGYPGIDAVQISLDGVPADVPLTDGTLVSQPLVRSDYSQLLLPPRPESSAASGTAPSPAASSP